MITTNIKNTDDSQPKSSGGFFSQFHISAGAVLMPVFAQIMDNLKEFEKFFTGMMNDSIQGQVVSAKATAKATESSLIHEADGMIKQSIASFVSSGLSIATTAADVTFSVLNSRTADGVTNDIETTTNELNNAKAYKAAYEESSPAASLNEQESETSVITNAKELYDSHINETDDVIKTPIDTPAQIDEENGTELTSLIKESDYIKTADEKNASQAIKSFDQKINERGQRLTELQDQRLKVRNKFEQIQTIIRSMSFTTELPNSIGSMLNATEKKLQAVQEKLKVLLSSVEQINKSVESKMGQEYNSIVQTLNQTLDQFKQLAAADAYRGG